jgi:hypothetical protein
VEGIVAPSSLVGSPLGLGSLGLEDVGPCSGPNRFSESCPSGRELTTLSQREGRIDSAATFVGHHDAPPPTPEKAEATRKNASVTAIGNHVARSLSLDEYPRGEQACCCACHASSVVHKEPILNEDDERYCMYPIK